jgi:hypothetical protein
VGGDYEFAGFCEAEPAAHVIEAALDGERGRRENHGGNLLKDLFVQ